MTSNTSLRSAINAKCRECIYDPYAKGLGKWREQVAACVSVSCPLHAVRPRPRPAKQPAGPECGNDTL